MVKAIATDLDGTLFYPKRRLRLISSKNKQFVKNAIERNIEIILVTGRNFSFERKVANAVKLEKSISIIACNGSLVIKKGEVLFENYFTCEEASRIYNSLKDYPNIKNWMLFTSEGIMYVEPSGLNRIEFIAGVLGLTFQGAYFDHFKVSKKKFIEKLSDQNVKIYKIMPWFGYRKISPTRAIEAAEKWKKQFKDEFNFFYTEAAVEIMPKGVDKADALNKLLDNMKIDHDDVYVIGDSGNDIPLFREFKNSFVMEQAHDLVKKEAKTVISSVSDIEKYL